MIAVELTFPAKRFHATPWGRHVNEGAVEWPPSPWRFLRAMLAVWRHKLPNTPEADMRRLISALTPAPYFRLPGARQGHTRHFMPTANDERTKVFDTFVAVDKSDPLIIAWPNVSLDQHQRDLLSQLLGAMTYFGRTESWVIAKLIPEWGGGFDAVPLDALASQPVDVELVRVLAPLDEYAYSSWRAGVREDRRRRKLQQLQARAAARGKSVDTVKLTRKDEAAIDANLPPDIFTALDASTDQLRKAGWNLPPGSQWTMYARPAYVFASKPRRQTLPRRKRLSTTARFAVCGVVRPRLTKALWIGERVRELLMGCSKSIMPDNNAAVVFSGKYADGAPLTDSHSHAHYLCEAPEHDGRITHITVYASRGFTQKDELALSRLRRIWGYGGHDMQLVLLGIGEPHEFGGFNEKAGQSRILAESTEWISRTPFVLTRHLKFSRRSKRDIALRDKERRQGLEQALRLELERRPQFRHLAGAAQIVPLLEPEQMGTTLGGRFTPWLQFRRTRHSGGTTPADHHGYGFLIRFSEPVRGPIALGYGCHFGLGQFIPADSRLSEKL